jgi:hypothetical protein
MARLGLAIHEFGRRHCDFADWALGEEPRSSRVLVDAKAKPWHDGVV